MERLTQTSDRGGVAFTFDLDITCEPSEIKKILKLAEKLKDYEDLGYTLEELKLCFDPPEVLYEIGNETDEEKSTRVSALLGKLSKDENPIRGKAL